MSQEYIAAVVICAALGYWGVSWAIEKLSASIPQGPRNESGGSDAPKGDGQKSGASNRNDGTPSSESWYAVLGIASNASADEIKMAYRSKLNLYHPDRVASLGEELRTVAEKKTKQLNAAYTEAVKARGPWA
jgi:DnaJ-domain-containing protein 1